MIEVAIILNEIAEVWIAYYFFSRFAKLKIESDKLKFLILSITVLVGLLFNNIEMTLLLGIINIAYFCAMVGTLFQVRMLQSFWLSFKYIVLGVAAEIISIILLTFTKVETIQIILQNPYYFITSLFLSKAILFFIIKVLVFYSANQNNKFDLKHIDSVGILIFPLMAIINEYLIIYLQLEFELEPIISIISLFAGALWIIVSFMEVSIINYQVQKTYDKELIFSKEEEAKANRILLANHEKSLEDIKLLTHDFKKHLLILDEAYKKDEIFADNYSKELIKELDENLKYAEFDFNNILINNIFYDAYIECKELDINLLFDLSVKDLSFIKPLDATKIFANLIENSIEASKRIEDKKLRNIKIVIKESEYFVLVEITNFYIGEIVNINNKIVSTKKYDREIHGQGIGIVKDTLKKYDANIDIDYKNNIFSVHIRFHKCIE